jgi:hypothetical protein
MLGALTTIQAIGSEPQVPAAAVTEWGRAVERLFIVLTGALSLLCGYRLFFLVSSEAGQMMAKGAGWQIRLARVGPGVFFALFGSAIVMYAMASSPSVVYRSGSDDVQKAVVEIHGGLPAASAGSISPHDYIVALNTLGLIKANTGTSDKIQLDQLAHAVETLEPLKRELVNAELGRKSAYDEWYQLHQLQMLNSPEFTKAMSSEQVRQQYNRADALLSETQAAPQ